MYRRLPGGMQLCTAAFQAAIPPAGTELAKMTGDATHV